MSNSPLVTYTRISPNRNSPRRDKIRKITIHHMAGNLSLETVGNLFASSTRKASSNYGIDSAGRVGMYVEEKDRAWTSSNGENDHQAITIEVANDGSAPDWHVSDTALAKLIDLCVDICKRNGIKQLNYTGDKNGNLTRHNMFAATACPGPYLQSKFPYIAAEVNKRLTVTAPTGYILHTIKPGDTFWVLANDYGTTVEAIQAANLTVKPTAMQIGDALKIPIKAQPPAMQEEIDRLNKELTLARAQRDGLQIQIDNERKAHAEKLAKLQAWYQQGDAIF